MSCHPQAGRVRLAVCVVAGFQDGKLTHGHIYWNQAWLLVQVGPLDPAGLPVAGVRQAEKPLAVRTMPANTLLGDDRNPRSLTVLAAEARDPPHGSTD
jgi:carboxymethylenebutenolidase